MATEPQRREALAELIGGLCYALLRSFQVAARGATSAAEVSLLERQAAFAVEEYERYKVLRAQLDRLTSDPGDAMLALRAPLDAFYDSARAEGWLETQVFQFVGATITTDFAEILAPRVDQETGEAVREALSGRTEQEAFALEQIGEALERDAADSQERIARFAGAMVGHSLNTLREALLSSDALEVVLGEAEVKDVVLEVLGRHRERLVRLGLDTLEEE